ncbi:MAG: hypothetical protein K2X26_07555 [Chitinophagaceae bacterium]|nr:hypothetical protein [Chitinophagaceae bacterium]
MKKIISILLILLLSTLVFDSALAQKRKKKTTTKAKKTTLTKKKSTAQKQVAKKISTAKTKSSTNSADAEMAIVTREGLSDTTGNRTVIITSSFKPSLQYAAKINFTAATPVTDSSKIPLEYKVPSSNLFFSYQPLPIKPLALPADSGITWQNNHRVKIGLGNYSTVLADGRFSFGDGKKSITNLGVDYITAKSDVFAQQYSKFGIDVKSIINTDNNIEWTTEAFFNSITQFRYGVPGGATSGFTKDQLKQIYNTLCLELGLRNKMPNEKLLSYHPKINYYRFTDNVGAQDNNIILQLPVEKSFTKILSFALDITGDFGSTVTPVNRITNNLYQVNPAVIFSTPNVKINAGIMPSWDNNAYNMLPDISATLKMPYNPFSFELGWVGYYTKNSFRSLTGTNPWISQPTNLSNTRTNEQYIGIKGNVGNHISYGARVSYLRQFNQVLFTNNMSDSKFFDIIFEPEIKAFKVHGEVNYTVQEKLSFIGSTNITQFNEVSQNLYAWGLVPFDITGGAQWKPLKDLQIKADIFFRSGSLYRNAALKSDRLPATFDVNLGGEFAATKNINIWLQLNNLFNNKYQRWNQYPVFGFNVIAGVVYSFK